MTALIAESGRSHAALARQVVHIGWTEHGMRFAYDYRSIGRWVRGSVPEPPAPAVLATVFSRILNRSVTTRDLGFDHGDMIRRTLAIPTSPANSVETVTELWRASVERRTFLQDIFVSALAVEAALDWRDVPAEGSVHRETGTRTVTTADVERLYEVREDFGRLDHLHGGGYALPWLTQYLDTEVAPLLRGRYTNAVGADLFVVAATLTDMAGWMAMDAGHQGLAQRCYTQATALAKHAGDSAYGAYVLGNLATQALFVGQARTSVRLARAARNTGGRAITPTLTARIITTEARAHALIGDVHETHRALIAADRAMDRSNPATDPDWLGVFTPAHFHGSVMHALRDLGDFKTAETYATGALNLPVTNIRTRALHSVLHASVQAERGNLDGAVETAGPIQQIAPGIKSQRLDQRLDELAERLTPHQGVPVVAAYLEGHKHTRRGTNS
ncbi:hypothetical protein ACIG87_30760 [Micromonospora sp. NPDC051925]|uniref:hypothetical protein n=1 Tax=Micromonospora sp. NPDC051925 TaxID=3364288 RepID=UPI0037CBFD0E